MRAAWWFLKIAARALTRFRNALEGGAPVAGGAAVDYLDAEDPSTVRSIREFKDVYARTFCGECGAGPERPGLRCDKCRAKFTAEIQQMRGDELERFERLVRKPTGGG